MQNTDRAPGAQAPASPRAARNSTPALGHWPVWPLLAALLAPAGAGSQTLTVYEEQGNLIRASRNVTALGHEAFGDRVNPYTGSLEFVQIDLSVPGNNALPVQVGRRLKTGSTFYQGGHFGDWELEIPHLKGVFSSADGWTVDRLGTDKYRRCTQFDVPADARSQTGDMLFPAQLFWQGNYLYVPGNGEQELLLRAAGNGLQPLDGQSYPVVTKAGWQLRCLATLANGGPGEGFVAVAPDGTQYRFDWMVSRRTTSYRGGGGGGGGGGGALATLRTMGPTAAVRPPTVDVAVGSLLARDEVLLLPTLVTDRFGNSVNYIYDAVNHWQLKTVSASDGRSISLTYDGTSHRIVSAASAGRTWTYGYAGSLSTVTQPDNTRWQFSGSSLQFNPAYTSAPAFCSQQGSFSPQPLSKTLIHPSGLTGTFTLTQTMHGRSYVQPSCPTPQGASTNWFPVYFLTRSLTTKTLSGPGLSTLSWSFNYGTPTGGVLPCTGCSGTKTVLVTDARGHVARHTYGTRWQVDEGQLQRLDEGWNAATGTAQRSTSYTYRPASAGPYPNPPGYSLQMRGDSQIEAQHRPQDSRTIAQAGQTFQWRATAYDVFARPVTVSRASSLGSSRTETTAYFDHTTNWVLGQVASLTEAASGRVVENHQYDTATALRTAGFKFGRQTDGYSYRPDGTLQTHTDAGGRATTYSNYKRGLAQLIQYPDATGESAVVDDWGLITRHTNPAGSVHDYAYDLMGRLARVTYPAGDAAAYHPTTLAFEPVAYPEVGLPAGHWRQTVSTGNAITTRYFDALWRPRLALTWDAANPAGTRQAQQTRWDADGRKTFESYPQRDIATVDATVPGTAWAHDALGRVFRQYQDSELGLLTTSTDYLSGFIRRVTNPRGHATSASFQAFDTPSEETITTISAPEGVTVNIARDVFGKPLGITRGGGGASATRSYVYDPHQRLCKTIEPETGATVQAYDGAGNIAWRASGLALPGTTSCDQGSVPVARMINHGYDVRNRLTNTTYGDGSPGIGRNYTADGLPLQVWSAGSTWTYGYNSRRKLTSEVLNFAGSNFATGWGIDAYGSVASLVYPDSAAVAFSPNALGQPTQVSGYASAVSHQPNGAVAGYILANGVAHSVVQNTRGLPQTWRDAGVVQDFYAYDANGNVTGITDQQEGVSSRSLGYDALDRLTAANGVWGAGSYSYDALDNLRASTVGARVLSHNIDAATNRLSSLTGSLSIGLAYDANGNLTQRGAQTFAFDIGNRLQSATGKASYTYDGHGRRIRALYADGSWKLLVYSQAGKLVFGQHSEQGGTRHVYLGDKLIAETSSATGVTTFSHTDVLGSPVARTSSGGGLLSRTRYEPYGATAAGTNPTGIGFTGHVNDADTGLVYMQQRYYEPMAGRFLSVDPVTTDAKTSGHFNRYVYAENSPYKYKDPDGRVAQKVAVDFVLNVAINIATTGSPQLGSALIDSLVGALNPAKTVQKLDKLVDLSKGAEKVAQKGGDAAKGGKDVLVLGRRDGLEKLAKVEGGQLSQTSSTSAKDIYKQNSSDIRAADRIIFNERNVPKTAEGALHVGGGEFSRAERELILSRPDLLEKTTFVDR